MHAAKGSSRMMEAAVKLSVLDKTPCRQTKIPGALLLYLIDTFEIKSKLFSRLLDPKTNRPISIYDHDQRLDPDDQQNIHDELPRHLSAEHLIRAPNGKLTWEQIRKDNHYLDCLVVSEACEDVRWPPQP